MKRILLLTLMLLFIFNNFYGQAKIQSEITISMAKKISYYCRYNKEAFFFFAGANPDIVQYKTDIGYRVLENLDKHLDCAENFVIKLYFFYGVGKSYFVLKDAGFTIQEIDKAELLWEKEKSKQSKIKNEKRKEEAKQSKIENEKRNEEVKAAKSKETALLKLAINGELFNFSDLTIQPNIELKIKDSSVNSYFRNNKLNIGQEKWKDCFFDCIISKDGLITLASPKEINSFTEIQKIMYEYLINNAIVRNSSSIKFEYLDTTIAVNAKVNLSFFCATNSLGKPIEFSVKKDKKSKAWEILNKDNFNSQLNSISLRDAEEICHDIENKLNNNPFFVAIEKGKYIIKANIFENIILFFIGSKAQQEVGYLPYSYEFKY